MMDKGVKITYTHIGLKSMGNMFSECENENYKIVFQKCVKLDDVDLLTVVDIDNGDDLCAVTIRKCDKLTIPDIAEQIKGRFSTLKARKDEMHKKQTKIGDYLPAVLVQAIGQIATFLNYNLNISIPAFGLGKHQFGSLTLTNVSTMALLKDAMAPLVNITRSSAIMVMCNPQSRVLVKDGKLTTSKIMQVNITLDGRYHDQKTLPQKINSILSVWQDPAKFC